MMKKFKSNKKEEEEYDLENMVLESSYTEESVEMQEKDQDQSFKFKEIKEENTDNGEKMK